MHLVLYLIIGLAIIAILAIIGFILINNLMFAPDNFDKKNCYRLIENIPENKEVTFGEKNKPLTGWIFNEKSTEGLVIVAHETGTTVDWYIPEITRFIENGYKVFAFEYSGYRGCKGKFRGFTQAALELKQAVEFAGDELPITVFGHGTGAYAACILPRITDAKISRIIACAPFFSVEAALNCFSKNFSKKRLFISAIYAYQKIKFGKTAKLTAADGLNSQPVKTLVLQGKHDEEISADASLFTNTDFITNPNVTFKLIDKEGSDGHITLLRKDFSRDINSETFEYIDDFLKNK